MTTSTTSVTLDMGRYWFDGRHLSVQGGGGAWHALDCGEPFCTGCYDP